jgi:hypothetical protein
VENLGLNVDGIDGEGKGEDAGDEAEDSDCTLDFLREFGSDNDSAVGIDFYTHTESRL